jgi:hypothetical protein
MKSKRNNVAIVRRIGRRKSRVKVGMRAFSFFLVLALLIATFAISLNMKIEDAMRRDTAQGGR